MCPYTEYADPVEEAEHLVAQVVELHRRGLLTGADIVRAKVLRVRCESGSRNEVAAVLGISPETARWHLARFLARCGRVDEAQAAFRHY